MYIARAKWTNRCGKTYESLWLRESYRDENGGVRTRNLINLKDCDPLFVECLEQALERFRRMKKGSGDASGDEYGLEDLLYTQQDKSFGEAFAAVEVSKLLGIAGILGESEDGKMALWRVVTRLLEQSSRLSAVRAGELHDLAAILDMESGFTENDLYRNLAWLSERQSSMEESLFSVRYPHGSAPSLFLYDVTSGYPEGVENEFAEWGYNRDRKKGKKRIVVGLSCDDRGIPVSVEVFEGNTSDPKTVGSRIEKVAKRFGCERATFVGDRGMLKSSPLEALASEGFSYITGITKALPEVALKKIRDKIERLKIASWLSVELDGRRSLKLLVDEKALAEEALLDGCCVLKTDLPGNLADKETVNARYKSLSEVERAFRSCKTLLEPRPVHVRTKESTRGHVFVVMPAYMMRQALERAWNALDLTVEEGLNHLKTLCVMRFRIPGGEEIRFLPRPSDTCAKLLDALGVKLPKEVSRSTANVRTYKKLKKEA